MLRRVTLSLLFVLLATISFNTAEAAFPTEKTSKEAVAAVPVTKTNDENATRTFSNKEANKEAKELSKRSVTSRGGKSKIVAALLAIFLGSFGVHSFYMGQTSKGFLQLGLTIAGIVLFAAGIAGSVASIGYGGDISGIAIVGYLIILGVGIWALVDFVRILTGSLEPEEGFDS